MTLTSFIQSPASAAALTMLRRSGYRYFSSKPYYVPMLTEKRVGEAGRGGRSSEAAKKVAVFGASGFLGGYVCSELGANGYMAYVGNRGDDMEMRHLKTQFDLGRLRYVFYSCRDIESVKEVIADADVVVNMIGKYYESGQPIQIPKFPYVSYRTNFSFHDTNVKIPAMLAEVCKEMQVDHFVHVSSASANPDSVSEWSRTKYEGEMAVKEIYPWATIIRPTQLFGRKDRLTKWFADASMWYPYILLCNGGHSLTQPVFVHDVAKVILAVCDDSDKFEGREIDCFGPNDYSYKELAVFVNDIIDRNRPHLDVPYPILRKMSEILQYRRDPLFTPDSVDQWSENFLPRMTQAEYDAQPDTATKIITLKDFGIVPVTIEKIAFSYLHSYRFGGHFFRTPGYH